MYTMIKHLNNKFIKIQQDYQFVVLCKVITLQFLHMVKLVQEKPIQCKDSDIICMMIKEVLYQEQFRIYLDTYNLAKIKM
jgi:hypothetical protein